MTTATANPQLTVLPAAAPVKIDRGSEEIVVRVPAGCEASILETYEAQGSGSYATTVKIRVMVAENARLTHYKVVREGALADHHSFLEAQLDKTAVLHSHVFLLDGAKLRNTIQVRMGEASEVSLNGLYLGTGQQVIETHTLIDHQGPHGTSREFYKGILDQKAQGVFDGLIIVEKEAQKTDSAQSNKNLLLSREAHAKSVPELKILANDVKCKHGSTIGQIDATQLFYMRSRGIPESDARRLLIYAFASEMITQVEEMSLRETLEKWLLEKFQA